MVTVNWVSGKLLRDFEPAMSSTRPVNTWVVSAIRFRMSLKSVVASKGEIRVVVADSVGALPMLTVFFPQPDRAAAAESVTTRSASPRRPPQDEGWVQALVPGLGCFTVSSGITRIAR